MPYDGVLLATVLQHRTQDDAPFASQPASAQHGGRHGREVAHLVARNRRSSLNQLRMDRLAELNLEGLALVDGTAIGSTERGPFRLEIFASGIVRLAIGAAKLPDYGILAAGPQSPPIEATLAAGAVTLRAEAMAVSVTAQDFLVTLARDGITLLGPPKDAHFRRRYRLPRFAATERGYFCAIDLAEGEPVYGHGEKWSRLDHRGQLITSWNEDALGVNAEISYKNCPLAWSPRGWGLFVHTPGRVVHGVGFAPFSHRSYTIEVEDERLDLFLIAAADPADVIERFTWLTGRPAPVPRWSLGAWLSKAYYRDPEELVAAARNVRALDLPMDTITLDGRAWQETRTRFAFQWDGERYPEPGRVLAEVRALGFKVCCWEYPLVSIHNPLFGELARRGFLLTDARTGRPWVHHWDPAPFGGVLTPLPASGLVDFTNPAAFTWWRDQHAALFAVGVDVVKSDFGEQVPDDPDCVAFNGDRGPRLHNVYALLYNRCVFEARRQALGQGLVFARSGWAGSQRYPVQWGGDPQADWGGLAASIRGMLSWAASGNPWYATDIGGFYGDEPDAELFVRWCQVAVFASHMRFHGIGDRAPWRFGPAALVHVRDALALRYALIPYIERCLEETCATGMPLCRPMALAFPPAREAHAFDTQYLFGPDLLVAPVLFPGGRVTVYLPEGVWHDWHTGQRHVGPLRLEESMALDRFPLYARGGAAIPLAAPVQRTAQWGDGAIPLAETRLFA